MPINDLIVTDRNKVREKCKKTLLEIQESINILKQWIETQKHLPEIPDDNIIEFMLTNCKFSIEKTKQNLDMYYTIRTLIPEFFQNPSKSFDLSGSFAKVGYCVVMPKQTDNFYRVTFFKYNENSGDLFDPYKVVAYSSNIFEVKLHEDLVLGEVLIFDAQHLTMSHVLKFTPALFKKFMVLMEKVWSCSVKGIHVINYSTYIHKLKSMAKVFFNKKMYNRIYLHPNIEDLYKYIPQEMLPSDYGGKEKSLQELTDLWQIKFKEYEKRFNHLDCIKVDESLRPAALSNSDILGYYGNFKKLDLD